MRQPGLGDNGGGFFRVRADDPAALAAAREELQAPLRAMVGEEEFGRIQRSRELREHPRLLTDQERSVLREAAAPLLRDLAATGMSLPDIRDEAHEDGGAGAVCAWIQGPGPTGEGLRIWLDSSPARQVEQLAGQFQSWAADQLHDAGRPPGWPGCPDHEHPDPYRLEPDVRDAAAVWVCLGSGQVIAEIGALRRPGDRARARRRRDRRA